MRCALAIGVFGALPALAIGLGTRAASGEVRLAHAAVFASAAAAAAIHARIGSGLAASLAHPRHAGLALSLLAIAGGLGIFGSAIAAVISVAWAWRHRGALSGSTPRATGRLAFAAAIAGAPAALWAAPILIDGPMIVEDALWSGCSPYQRILVTRTKGVFRLWLDGQLQLQSDDERPYHESLVHPALALAIDARRVLVLGGGDGLVVREVLLDPDVAHVVVVDIDRAMTELARRFAPLRALGGAALSDRRVTLLHDDALRWVPAAVLAGEKFDVVIADLPDPASEVLAPLFARETFAEWAKLLTERGVIAVQAGAPRAAPKAFASVVATLRACELSVLTLSLDAPESFGGTAVALASVHAATAPRALRIAARWLNPERLAAGFASPDARPVDGARITTLADPAVLGYLRGAMRGHRAAS